MDFKKSAELKAKYPYVMPLTPEDAKIKLSLLYTPSSEAEEKWEEFLQTYKADTLGAKLDLKSFNISYYLPFKRYFSSYFSEDDFRWFIAKTALYFHNSNYNTGLIYDDAVAYLDDEGLFLHIMSETYAGYSLYATSMRDLTELLEAMIIAKCFNEKTWQRLWVTSNLNRVILNLHPETVHSLYAQGFGDTVPNYTIRSAAAYEGIDGRYPLSWAKAFCKTGTRPDKTTFECVDDPNQILEDKIGVERIVVLKSYIEEFLKLEDRTEWSFSTVLEKAENQNERLWIEESLYLSADDVDLRNAITFMWFGNTDVENVCGLLRKLDKQDNGEKNLSNFLYSIRQSFNYSGVLSEHLITCFNLGEEDLKIVVKYLPEDYYTDTLVEVLIQREAHKSIPLKALVKWMHSKDTEFKDLPEAWLEKVIEQLYGKLIRWEDN